MQENVRIYWIQAVNKSGKTYDYIKYVFEDENGEVVELTRDYNMNDIKRYVLKQLGIKLIEE